MQELTAFGLIQIGLVNETPAVPTYQVKSYEEILKILSK